MTTLLEEAKATVNRALKEEDPKWYLKPALTQLLDHIASLDASEAMRAYIYLQTERDDLASKLAVAEKLNQERFEALDRRTDQRDVAQAKLAAAEETHARECTLLEELRVKELTDRKKTQAKLDALVKKLRELPRYAYLDGGTMGRGFDQIVSGAWVKREDIDALLREATP